MLAVTICQMAKLCLFFEVNMSNELEILKNVEEKNTITQRELAKRTGLSLGSVNVLLKRLIHKGFVKIEHINAKTLGMFDTERPMKSPVNI